MTRGSRAVTAQITHYTGRKPDGVINLEGYEAHDPTTTWDDQGISSQIVQEDYATLISEVTRAIEAFRDQQAAEMRAYGAAQVQEAVVDYITQSDLQVGTYDGHVIVALDASSDNMELRPWWYLEDLLKDAIDQSNGEVERALQGLLKRVLPEVVPAPPRRAAIEPPPPATNGAAPPAKTRRRRAGAR